MQRGGGSIYHRLSKIILSSRMYIIDLINVYFLKNPKLTHSVFGPKNPLDQNQHVANPQN